MQHTLAPRTPRTRPWLKPLFFAAGAISLTVGVVGVVLPLIPTTGPLLLAAYFFARSSERFHSWLIDHPRLGPPIADFRAGRGIPLATKIWALVAMAVAFAFGSIFVATHPVARALVIAIGIGAIAFVAALPASRR